MFYAVLALSITTAALLGRLASRERRRLLALGAVVVVVLVASAILLSVGDHLGPQSRLTLATAAGLVVALTTLPTFVSAWVASGPAWSSHAWIWLSATVGVASLIASPFVGIYASCYILHDCL